MSFRRRSQIELRPKPRPDIDVETSLNPRQHDAVSCAYRAMNSSSSRSTVSPKDCRRFAASTATDHGPVAILGLGCHLKRLLARLLGRQVGPRSRPSAAGPGSPWRCETRSSGSLGSCRAMKPTGLLSAIIWPGFSRRLRTY